MVKRLLDNPARRKAPTYSLRRFRGRVVSGRKLQTRIAAGNNLWFVQHVDKNGADVPAALELPFESKGPGADAGA